MALRALVRPLRHAKVCTRALSTITTGNINPAVLNAEYAVRGELIMRATAIKQEMASNPSAVPFDKLVECNIGNPQALQQQPVSFNRQVLSLMMCPQLLEMPGADAMFPADVRARAREYLNAIPNGVGAYSESQGFGIVRQQVADFITERDGGILAVGATLSNKRELATAAPCPASDAPALACHLSQNKDDIFLTDGASKGVGFILSLLLRGRSDGVLVPIPQYPLYSATLALQEAHMLGYELDENDGWALPTAKLEAKLEKAKADGVETRCLVVINPGNPTGNSLPYKNMVEVVKFCAKHKLVLMADEVYQENVYDDALPFYSFKKVLEEMNPRPNLELVSLHSTSKGFLGECGLRGGYFELVGFDKDVQAQLLKLISIGLCSNTLGQIATGLMVRPPTSGEASHNTYVSERDAILSSMKRRATKLVAGLNSLEGVSCNQPQGAMYAFPQITLPAKAIAAAEAAGKVPDTFYALALLEETGIVVVPGSGFGQVPGTWHFRTTFLPPEEEMEAVVERMGKFHKAFMAKYA